MIATVVMIKMRIINMTVVAIIMIETLETVLVTNIHIILNVKTDVKIGNRIEMMKLILVII